MRPSCDHTNKIFARANHNANEWFATALANLHAETFHTDPSTVRMDFRFVEYDYSAKYVSYPNFSHFRYELEVILKTRNVGRSKFREVEKSAQI
jgi:hypothetical protein